MILHVYDLASCSLNMIMRIVTCELSCSAQSIKKLWAFVVKSLFSVLYVLASLFTNSLFSVANLTVSYGGCMNSCNDIWLSAVNNIRFSFLDVDIPFFYSLLFSVIVIFGESFKPYRILSWYLLLHMVLFCLLGCFVFDVLRLFYCHLPSVQLVQVKLQQSHFAVI